MKDFYGTYREEPCNKEEVASNRKKSLTLKKENVQMVKSAFEIIDWIQLNTFHRGCKLMFMAHENADTKMLERMRGDALMTPSFNRIIYTDEENILETRQKKGTI